MPPEVSVLIPSYNHARFLRECLDSILAQTFRDFEVVIVDDGSTDESVALIRSYDDPRVRISVNDFNRGTYGTLAHAQSLALGRFLAVMNSDDVWHPEKLQRQVELLRDHRELSFVFTLGELIDECARRIDIDVHADWPREPRAEYLPWLLHENRILASSVMFRSGEANFDPSWRYSGDWALLLRLSLRGPAACLPEPLTKWRQHGANSYVRSKGVTLEEIRMRRAILAHDALWRSRGLPDDEIDRGLGRCALNLLALYLLVHQPGLARQAGLLAARYLRWNATARKRLALAYLPLTVARRRLWGSQDLPLTEAEITRLPGVSFCG